MGQAIVAAIRSAQNQICRDRLVVGDGSCGKTSSSADRDHVTCFHSHQGRRANIDLGAGISVERLIQPQRPSHRQGLRRDGGGQSIWLGDRVVARIRPAEEITGYRHRLVASHILVVNCPARIGVDQGHHVIRGHPHQGSTGNRDNGAAVIDS